MASPFPGMDPYLESPVLWPGVHQRLITYAADHLQPQIRPQYVAIVEERVYLSEPQWGIYPDVSLVRRPSGRPEIFLSPDSAGVAVADRPDTLTLDEPTWIEGRIHFPSLVILHRPIGIPGGPFNVLVAHLGGFLGWR